MQWQERWSKLALKQKALFIISGIGIAGICLLLLLQTPSQAPAGIITESPQEKDNEVLQKIYAEVTGQVKNPGVYLVTKETLVLEFIEQAGGFTDNADLGYVHKTLKLAVAVKNGEKIYVPSKSEEVNTTVPSSKLVSLNTASRQELMELPGIGEVTADKIIAARPYAALEDLKNVSGIGDSTYNKIVTQLVL